MAVNNSSNVRQINADSGSAIVTAAVPNWNIVGGTNVTTSASGNTITIAASGSSVLVQQVRAESTTSVSTTKNVSSTTLPTTANSDLIISATISPTSASNFLIFNFVTPYSADSDAVTQFSLFQGTTFLAGFPQWQNGASIGAERNVTGIFTYYMQAPSTSSTTFNVYWASSAGGITLRTLQNSSGSAFYGAAGRTKTQLIITEIAI